MHASEVAAARRKREHFPKREADVSHAACASPFYSIEQFCRRNPVFTPASVRWLVFRANENGIEASGAIIRNGRSIVIDEPAFFSWFRSRKAA